MALFRLAEKMGYLDPDAMGQAMPAELVGQWLAYWIVKAEKEKQAVDSASRK